MILIDNTLHFNSIINGSYTPSLRGLFLANDGSDSKANRIKFHEYFHLWQNIFTPYGCMRSYFDNTQPILIVDGWLRAHDECENLYLPLNEMHSKVKMSEIGHSAYIDCITHLSFLYIIDAFEKKTAVIKDGKPCVIFKEIENIVPTIIVDEKEYELNGIDIMESFAKYQEACYSVLFENMEFLDVMNPRTLPKEYFMALEYFVQELGFHRINEFPIVCEISLHVADTSDMTQKDWQLHHPAWRFVQIIEVLKNNLQIILPNKKDIKEKFNDYVDELLFQCNFSSRKDVLDNAESFIKGIGYKSLREKLEKALDFKKAYPWILSLPFLSNENERSMIQNFLPDYISNMDSTLYVLNKESEFDHLTEIDKRTHMQALSRQIAGQLSAFCRDRFMLNCGYTYYNIKTCSHFINGKCSGVFDIENDFIANEKDFSYCLFNIFLDTHLRIDVSKLCIGDLNDKFMPTLR